MRLALRLGRQSCLEYTQFGQTDSTGVTTLAVSLVSPQLPFDSLLLLNS